MKNTAQFLRFCLSIVLCCLFLPSAGAHFSSNTKVRQFVVTAGVGSTEVFVRTPIPLLFGDVLNGERADGRFLINYGSADEPRIFLFADGIKANSAEFTRRLAASLKWYIGWEEVPGRVRAYRVLPTDPELKLISENVARASLREPSVPGDVAVSDGYVDIHLSIPGMTLDMPLRVKSGYPAVSLAAGVQVDNHFIDTRADASRQIVREGQLQLALGLPQNRTEWFIEYIWQGALHVFGGLDHVMLVVAMSLGAMHGMALFRAVTAFTLGHSITLVCGFLGYGPEASWFVPIVEIAIAASIVLVCILSLVRYREPLLVFVSVGLLHGFGFSFVLGDILGRDSPELLPALAAFNIGIEIAQLLIVASVLLLLFLTSIISKKINDKLRQALLLGILIFAGYMSFERVWEFGESLLV